MVDGNNDSCNNGYISLTIATCSVSQDHLLLKREGIYTSKDPLQNTIVLMQHTDMMRCLQPSPPPQPSNITSNGPSDGTEVNRNWIDDHYEWDVKSVLRHRYGPSGLEYKVRWLGYDKKEESWEPVFNLLNAPEKISQYYKRIARRRRRR